ncbi:MAG: hypothetical protein ACLQJR_15750 [Stellaceae bacterium]
MSVIFLRSLWTILRRCAIAVTGVGKLGEAERSTRPHHLVFIGM